MFKKIIVLSLSIASLPCFSNPMYIPSDFDKLKGTSICVGCDLSEARLPSTLKADLSKALLIRADLSGHEFYASNFSEAQITYANLSAGKFSGSRFVGTRLNGSNLSGGNFTSCDFTNASLDGVDLNHANLAWSNITNQQLNSAYSIECAILPDGTRNGKDC